MPRTMSLIHKFPVEETLAKYNKTRVIYFSPKVSLLTSYLLLSQMQIQKLASLLGPLQLLSSSISGLQPPIHGPVWINR